MANDRTDFIKGDHISLRPLREKDKETFYLWATQSEGTEFWYGEKVGEPIPTRKEFFKDFTDHYFDHLQPLKGRSFAISVNEDKKEIGQINYQLDEELNNGKTYDIDIIIADIMDQNKGFGSTAIILLTNYLYESLKIKWFNIYTLPDNTRAIKSFEKAGFKIQEKHYIGKDKIVWTKLSMEK